MSVRITKTMIDAASPRPKGDAYLWDSAVPGFGLKVTTRGSKSFIYQYRIGGRKGRNRRYTIGRYGAPWTVELARNEARRLAMLKAQGIDPMADKRTAELEAAESMTVAELCERYLAEAHIQSPHKKPRSWASDRSSAEIHIIPNLGKVRLADLTRAQIEKFQHDLAAGISKTNGNPRATGGRAVASRTIAALGAIINWGVRLDFCDRNPTSGVKKLRLKSRDRFLSLAEIAAIGAALDTVEAEGANPAMVAAIRLLMLTGARRGEVLNLRWSEIDFDNGFARLPDSKTGPKVLRLGAPALEILRALPRTFGPYVLPSGRARNRAEHELRATWDRVCAVAGIDGVRVHDLRHTVASTAVSAGVPIFTVSKMLGHADVKTTEKIYAHLGDDPLKQAADHTAGLIDTALRRKSGEVVELSKAKRPAPVGEVETLREKLAVQQARIQELEALVPKPRRAKSKR